MKLEVNSGLKHHRQLSITIVLFQFLKTTNTIPSPRRLSFWDFDLFEIYHFFVCSYVFNLLQAMREHIYLSHSYIKYIALLAL